VALGSLEHDLAHDRETQFDDDVHAGPTHVFVLTPVRSLPAVSRSEAY
jgi:hypothetical protein